MTTSSSADILRISPVIPVVVIHDVDAAVPLAQALARGGVGVIEITLRTPAGLAAVERVAAEVPEIAVGAGTVTTPEQVEAVTRAGASFISSCRARLRAFCPLLWTRGFRCCRAPAPSPR